MDIQNILQGSAALGGACDARDVTSSLAQLGHMPIEGSGSERNAFLFENALSRVLDGAETIGDTDGEAADGYLSVLGAAMSMPMIRKLNPQLIGRSGAVMSRMNAVIAAATKRQANETLRPNVIMIFDFNHDAANIAAGGVLEIKAKPSLPGVSTSYKDAPLSMRQIVVLLLGGAFASAVMNPKVAQIPMFQFEAPIGATPPAGINIGRFAPASYNYGLNSFAMRDTDEITLQTELAITSTATAVCRYQALWEMRAESAFGAGSRCIMPRGPSAVRGATAFAMPRMS